MAKNIHPKQRQQGIVLLVGLVFLLLISLLAVAMYRGLGIEERIAGNTLEKQRAHQAAKSAVQYAEWWIKNKIDVDTPLSSVLITCGTGSVNGGTVANLKVCDAPLSNPQSVPWAYRINYAPQKMTVTAGGGLVTSTSTGIVGDANYSQSPSFHIEYVGIFDNKNYFRVTGVGYGSGGTAASIVQSVYYTASSTLNLGEL